MPKKLKKLRKASDVGVIQKAGKLHENPAASAVLRKLRSYLDTTEPELVYFLTNLWKNQGKAITYKELREAILSGDIKPEWIEEWQQDYSRFVVKYLQPKWIEAMQEAISELEAKYPDWYFNPAANGIRDWTESHGAEFVTSSTDTQIQGLRALITEASTLKNMSVDQLARAIRPMVGLYYQQSIANMNYYKSLIESGLKEEKALDLSTRYAARQHRYRGYLIARTELAFAYNQGSYFGIKQAQAKGYMGEVVKIWSTALDERSCESCRSLEGKEIALDKDFDYYSKLKGRTQTIRRVPPAHPNCRCGVMYKEISPPAMQPKNN